MTVALRPRIVERLQRATAFPVTLLLAPAGSGKTVALQAFATKHDALRIVDAAATASVQDFARKLDAALAQPADALVVVDHVQAIQSDAACLELLLDRIAATTPTRRWILASRSSAGLPVGVWLSYGMCESVIASHDLAFTTEELSAAATAACQSIEPDDVRELAESTEGWAAAVGVALRSLAGGERGRWRSDVRDAACHLYDERAYAEIATRARDLLAVVAALPEIDVPLLEAAGFQDARRILEDVRQRTGLLSEESAHAYRAPLLFREYLRRQLDLQDADERCGVFRAAAGALESAGRIAAALDAYGQARARDDLLRLLEESGFDLLERGEAAAVTRAIKILSDAQKRSNPRILALRGALESLGGNAIRAEHSLRRALSRAGSDRDLFAFARLKLAPLIANYGSNVADILDPVASDKEQPVDIRADALSLRASALAMNGNRVQAASDVSSALECLHDIESDSTRAKVLQRLGVAAMYLRDVELAKSSLTQAAELSNELRLYSVASRALSALSNLMCHEFDDVMGQLWYAERAAAAASEGKDVLSLQTALLQVAAAEMRRGNAEESEAIEEQLSAIKSDPARAYLLVSFNALRLAWDGKFAEAHRLLAPCWNRMYHDFDKLVCGSECALFLALDDRKDASIDIINDMLALSDSLNGQGLLAKRSISIALLICCVAETVNERYSHASRIFRRMRATDRDSVMLLAAELAERFSALNEGPRCRGEISGRLERLAHLGYADISRLLGSASIAMDQERYADDNDDVELTEAELSVLKLLNEGLSNKEIAVRSKRSVYTVRAHVASLCKKLRCHGRGQAVAAARRLEILSSTF